VLFNYHGKNIEPIWKLGLQVPCAGLKFPQLPGFLLNAEEQFRHQQRMNL
jgi:hypothetical protein